MITVDISNVWGQIDLSDLLAIEKEVSAAHATLMEGTGAGASFRDWLKLPVREKTEELEKILASAEQIRADSDV